MQPKGSPFKYKDTSSVTKRSSNNQQPHVPFLLFSIFTDFVEQQTRTSNDPTCNLLTHTRKTSWQQYKGILSVHKPKYLPRPTPTRSSTIIGLSSLMQDASHPHTVVILLRPPTPQKCCKTLCFRYCTSSSYMTRDCITLLLILDQPFRQKKQILFLSPAGRQSLYQLQMQNPGDIILRLAAHRKPVSPLPTSGNLELNLTSNIDEGNNNSLLTRHKGSWHLKLKSLAWEPTKIIQSKEANAL